MASILRQIVAGPRSRHPEAGLDLSYITDSIIATSGPSSTYPQRAYRNPTDALVKWLDYKHGAEWAIWEFRAEGTGYPDSEVYGRVRHFPWPDHHPPPFKLVPNIMASMRNWLHDAEAKKDKKRVVVVHCKAGKGRSGTVAASYLISEEGWTMEDALQRFTARRMRPGFGSGISIPSQLRWIGYVDRWAKSGKNYVERPVEVVELHVWGLRDGVKLAVQGFFENGRKIEDVHVFKKEERFPVDPTNSDHDHSSAAAKSDPTTTPPAANGDSLAPPNAKIAPSKSFPALVESLMNSQASLNDKMGVENGGESVIFRPKEPILVPTSDINIDLERRNRAPYSWTVVTAVAHVWFNVFFEGGSTKGPPAPEDATSGNTEPATSGVFEISWDAMDGLKGSSKKGTRALDKMAVVWRIPEKSTPQVVKEPAPGEPVGEPGPADWQGTDAPVAEEPDKVLGLRPEHPGSAEVSKANSVAEQAEEKEEAKKSEDYEDSLKGVQSHVVDEPPGDDLNNGSAKEHQRP